MHVLAPLTWLVCVIRILRCRMHTKNHTPTLNTTSVMDMVAMVILTAQPIPMQHLRMTITAVTITPPTLKKRNPLTNF